MALVSAAQHIRVGSYERLKSFVHCTFEWGVKSVEQKASYAKVNKLQSPKLRPKQSLLVATFTQNFMRFRCMVMEKHHQNVSPHSSVCDDLYHACTFAWDKLCALFTPHWKMLRC